jgi:SAM-dependent methyltransferase
MHPDEVWLAASRRLIFGQLPSAPARVVELGCGPFGGHVPALIEAGYHAVGIDPEAPEGAAYLKRSFEEYDGDAGSVDALVASLSLHHVEDLGGVLDRIAALLRTGGTVAVVEWSSEHFDSATARWCFERLPEEVPEDDGWLHRKKSGWEESGLPWEEYLTGWLKEHGIHPAVTILKELEKRFTTEHIDRGPYYFPELANTSEADEQAAIDAGEIQPTRVLYIGKKA